MALDERRPAPRTRRGRHRPRITDPFQLDPAVAQDFGQSAHDPPRVTADPSTRSAGCFRGWRIKDIPRRHHVAQQLVSVRYCAPGTINEPRLNLAPGLDKLGA